MLSKEHNFLHRTRNRLMALPWSWQRALFYSIAVLILINISHNFCAPEANLPHHHWLLTGLASLCIAVYLISFRLTPLIYLRISRRQEQTNLMRLIYILIFVVVLHMVNYLYVSHFITPLTLTFDSLNAIGSYTLLFNGLLLLSIFSFPYFIRHYFVEKMSPTDEPPTAIIDLTPIKGRIYRSDEILYFKVYGNFVKIYLESNPRKAADILYISMKQLVELLKLHPEFQRCHRSYLINTNKIKSKTGTKESMQITLHRCDITFMVFRNYTPLFMTDKK